MSPFYWQITPLYHYILNYVYTALIPTGFDPEIGLRSLKYYNPNEVKTM